MTQPCDMCGSPSEAPTCNRCLGYQEWSGNAKVGASSKQLNRAKADRCLFGGPDYDRVTWHCYAHGGKAEVYTRDDIKVCDCSPNHTRLTGRPAYRKANA